MENGQSPEKRQSPLPPIHSTNNGIVLTKEDKAAAFAHSLEMNIDPDADDKHMDLIEETVEDLREEEP